MSVAAMRVPTIFTAQDRFSNVINTMTRNANTFGAGMNRINSKINNQFNSLNRVSQLAIAGGAGSLIYKAGDDIIEYEKAVASLGAVTGTAVGSMNKDIQSLGKETNRSVIDITKGFELIGSKMSQYLQNPTALKEIAKQGILMADASRMSAEDSIDNLTSLLNQFGAGYKDANRFVNKLSAGEDIGASTIAETTDVLRQFAASARMAGADVEESIALVQSVTKTLGKQGVGRNFRNIMTDLNTGKGMDKNKLAALKMVGIDINKMIDPATLFVDKMRELTKLSGNKQAMGMFFKKTGMEAGATFVRDFKYFEEYLKFIRANDTALTKSKKNNQTFAKTFQDLKNAFTNYVVTGDKANEGMTILKQLMLWMIPNMRNLVNLIGSVAVAFLGWKIIVGVVSFLTGVMTAYNGIMMVHRFVVLYATLTNTGYAASLWAVASATLAAYWPLLLIAGVLGGLVYLFWDTGDAADDMASKMTSSFGQSDDAIRNSTSVLGSELSKQAGLINNHNLNLSRNKAGDFLGKGDILNDKASKELATMDVNSANFDVKRYIELEAMSSKSSSSKFTKEILPTLARKPMDFSERQNLSTGRENQTSEIARLIEKRGELFITITDNNKNIESIDDSKTKGIKVRTSSTMGVK